MARRLQLTRDEQIAQSAAGVLIPDGSGRLVRRGVIVSAEDAARSSMDRARNSLLEMQTSAFTAPQQALAREMDRVGGFALPAMPEAGQSFAGDFGQPQPRPRRTLSGQVMPDAGADVNAFAPADFQGALATLRDARADVGDAKNYSDAKLDEIARMPGGAQRIINEATTVLPVVRQRRAMDQTINHVTGLHQNTLDLGKQIADVEARITAEPTIGKDEVAAQISYLRALPEYAETPAEALVQMAQDSLSESKRREWESANKNTLAVRDQLRRQQQEASGQVQEFAKRGVFPRSKTAPVAGASTAALGGAVAAPVGDLTPDALQRQRDSRGMVAAGDAAIAAGVNPGGAQNVSSPQSWLPPGSIAYQNRAGQYVVNGQAFANEAEARNNFLAQQAIPEADAAELFLAGLNAENDGRLARGTAADAANMAARAGGDRMAYLDPSPAFFAGASVDQPGVNPANINGVRFVRPVPTEAFMAEARRPTAPLIAVRRRLNENAAALVAGQQAANQAARERPRRRFGDEFMNR